MNWVQYKKHTKKYGVSALKCNLKFAFNFLKISSLNWCPWAYNAFLYSQQEINHKCTKAQNLLRALHSNSEHDHVHGLDRMSGSKLKPVIKIPIQINL
jgi:hypothetical protein